MLQLSYELFNQSQRTL